MHRLFFDDLTLLGLREKKADLSPGLSPRSGFHEGFLEVRASNNLHGLPNAGLRLEISSYHWGLYHYTQIHLLAPFLSHKQPVEELTKIPTTNISSA